MIQRVDSWLAVKAFRNKAYFTQENDILQKIKSIEDPHIIRHFASIAIGEESGYILFPWTDIGNLHDYWETSKPESFEKVMLWSVQQMQGLVSALRKLHEICRCRHGDLKPQNILCFEEKGEVVLKIADFGISKIHPTLTKYRVSATTSLGLTLSYRGPEVEFEKPAKDDQRPRSRKYDIWSLGCVFLEFLIWLLHGHEALLNFNEARTYMPSTSSSSTPLYRVTYSDNGNKNAQVHHLASRAIEVFQKDPRCTGETVLAKLLELVRAKMLKPEVSDRASAEELEKELASVIRQKQDGSLQLFNACERVDIPSIDFEKLKLDRT